MNRARTKATCLTILLITALLTITCGAKGSESGDWKRDGSISHTAIIGSNARTIETIDSSESQYGTKSEIPTDSLKAEPQISIKLARTLMSTNIKTFQYDNNIFIGAKTIITSKRANLRSEPKIRKNNVITQLERYHSCIIQKISDIEGSKWYKIKTGDRTGWVSSKECVPIDNKTNSNLLNLTYKREYIDLKKEFPVKYSVLYEKVSKYYSERDFDKLMLNQKAIAIDKIYYDKLKFLASPTSIRKQVTQHKNWVPILVNDDTVTEGMAFYEKHKQHFINANKETGVDSKDVLAILNWESRLGKYKGNYDVFTTFIGQYFYINEIEFELYKQGVYDQSDIMTRDLALKRINKIIIRALSNFSELLIKAKKVGFDPYKVKGSWAGAIGIPQFMPASMVYAKDGDNDGIIDLNTIADSVMSIANYLKENKYHEKGKEYALRSYNPEQMYINGVMLYSNKLAKLEKENEIISNLKSKNANSLNNISSAIQNDSSKSKFENSSNSLKTVINQGHFKSVSIIHDIDEKLIATYSESDNLLKVWNKHTLNLLWEYNIPEGKVEAIFDIKGVIYLKLHQVIYQIDLNKNKVKKLFAGAYLSKWFTVNESRIELGEDIGRYTAREIAYNYKEDKIIISKNTFGVCGACDFDDAIHWNGEIKAIVDISKDTKNTENISPKRFVASLSGRELKFYPTKHENQGNYILDYIGDTDTVVANSAKWYYLYNEKAGTLKYLVKAEENLSGRDQEEYSEALIDSNNNIVILKATAYHTAYGEQYFALIDFEGKFYGYSVDYSIFDKVDIHIIKHYLFLINHTQKMVVSYDLKNQTDLSDKYAKAFIADFKKHIDPLKVKKLLSKYSSNVTENGLYDYITKKIEGNTEELNSIYENILSDYMGKSSRFNSFRYHHIMKHNLTEYDLANDNLNKLIAKYRKENRNLRKIDKYDVNKNLLIFPDRLHLIKKFKLTPAKTFLYTGNLVDIKKEDNFLYVLTDNNIKFEWNFETGELLATDYKINEDTQIAITPEGYFSGFGDVSKYIYYVKDLSIIHFNQLYDVFYRPDIVEHKIKGNDIKPLITLTAEEAFRSPPPVVKINPVTNETDQKTLKITYDVESTGGGIGEVRVFQNGKLIKSDGFYRKKLIDDVMLTKLDTVNSRSVYNNFRGIKLKEKIGNIIISNQKGNNYRKTIEVEVLSGENEISICAFNNDNSIQSAIETVSFIGKRDIIAPKLYIFAIGIDKYKDGSINLKFASKDAKDFVNGLSQVSRGLYNANNIHTILLNDLDADKSNIIKSINKLSEVVKLNDVVVLFVASHGVLMGDQYFMVTHDYQGGLDEDCLISSNEFIEFSKKIKSLNQIYVLDTCHAGGMDYIIGGLYDARISVLAKKVGLHIFASSSSFESALDGYKGNGLFTHNLLKGLNENKEVDKNGDRNVSVVELGKYTEKITEEIARQLGHLQKPKIINFGKDIMIYRLK